MKAERDEIIDAAAQLFFSRGFEGTSVRQIISAVGGEVGMFYHYFGSKEELFDAAVDRFFTRYARELTASLEDVDTPEALAELILASYDSAMQRFGRVEESMHWSMKCALHERTLVSLIPAAQMLLERFGYSGAYPADIAASRAVASVSAALHSVSFSRMDEGEKKELLVRILKDCMS